MSAQQLIDTIRADEVTATIPIILISARATREDRQAGFEWGADGYVTKPFEPEVLLSQIEATLRSRARTIEAARPVIHLHPSDVEPRNSDEEFLGSVRDVIEDRMQDPAFDVNELARALGYSRSAFYRHLDELGVGSPAELIRQMRLERSLQLIEAGEASVSRIAWRVGFKSTSHFSKLFRDRFGSAPSEFVQRRRPPRG
jgi:AraC-like DNA-binding protein